VLSKLTTLERALILAVLILATLVMAVIFSSTLGKYIDTLHPTATLRSLPAVWTETPAPTATLRPSSTPLPTWTPASLASPTP